MPTKPSTAKASSLTVTSSAFSANGAIPTEYTCDGSETSPPLAWSGVPSGARSVAILVEDPDAPKGTFMHWLVTDIPSATTSLDKGASLPDGAMAAKNDKGNTGYAGPCPPTGQHHYHFRVYALDKTLGKITTRAGFQSAIKGHVLAQGELVGTYQKQASH
jgi:Raf kinase inhibitor-like YbhB/YbcL family protein